MRAVRVAMATAMVRVGVTIILLRVFVIDTLTMGGRA
jgi:hypothetical protein